MRKVLIYDIETSYIMTRMWGVGYRLNVTHDQIVKEFQGGRQKIICVAYKWAHEDKVHLLHSGVNLDKEAELIEKFDKVVSTAELVIAHNGDHFDMKHFNTGRLIHRLPPVVWPDSEDTLKVLRKNFRLPSNRLDYIAKVLTGKGKDHVEFQDWIDIVEHKSSAARRRMFEYCKRDVAALDEVAKIILPYVTTKNSRALAKASSHSCGNSVCTSPNVIKYGIMTTLKGKFQKYRCTNCGHNHVGGRI